MVSRRKENCVDEKVSCFSKLTPWHIVVLHVLVVLVAQVELLVLEVLLVLLVLVALVLSMSSAVQRKENCVSAKVFAEEPRGSCGSLLTATRQHILHCALCNVYCTLCIVHCALFMVHCALYKL